MQKPEYSLLFSQIETFLASESAIHGIPKILCVYGPTACGKTALAIELARRYNGEVISADSRQIYQMLDIGTAKPTVDELATVKHHLIDIIPPTESYSAARFFDDANAAIADIVSRGKLPIVCGGTGFYLDALLFASDIPRLAPNWGLRAELEAFRLEKGNEALWERLYMLDPETANTLHPNSYRFVMRALELAISGVARVVRSARASAEAFPTLRFSTFFCTPYSGNRPELYERINLRTKLMFKNGIVEEIQGVLASGIAPDAFGLHTIGYKEVGEYLSGQYTRDECEALVAQKTRQYAKRQETWFRRYQP